MKTIGKYQVADEIGRSPAGVTCRARDPFRNRDFALKILSPLAALSAASKDQLYRDLAISWDLSHRHIAKVHDVGELEGGVYTATELLVGNSLEHFLATHTVRMGDKLALLAQVCEALAYAHSQGLAHGNIKPGNIFVTDAGNAAILDFGTGTWQTLLLSSGVRLNGLLPNYLAPEQILGHPFDARSDIFAVGIILYEVLRGQYPFQAPAGLIPREIVHTDPEPLRKWNTLIPAELEEVATRALKKDPKDRFQTADELAANLYVLAQHLRREPPAPPEDAPALEIRTQGTRKPEVPAAVAPPVETPVSVASVPDPAPEEESQPVAATMTAPLLIAAPPPPLTPEPVLEPTAFGPPPLTTTPVVQQAAPAIPSPVSASLVVDVAPPPPPTRVAGAALRQPPSTPPAKAQKPGKRRLVTFAVGAVMALAMVGVIVVRQNQGAPDASPQGSVPSAATNIANQAPADVPERPKPAHVDAAPAAPPAQPAHVEPAPAQVEPEQVLRNQVRPLWEAGQYAQAMRLVDEVLTQSPANAEARTWKKKIRAAQEAEAAMK
jgi:serine/threonine protein kinase